nr:hypothetical protein [Micromonospora sp. DSM 115978]
TVRSPGSGADEQLLVQYAVAGPRRRKVYFLGERSLADGAALPIRRKHQVRHTTTRTLETGPHTVELLLNGVVRASAPLEVG